MFVDWDDDESGDPISNNRHSLEYHPVILKHVSPADFFYPQPPFCMIRYLYLCFDDHQKEKINLTMLMQLKHLKIRGKFNIVSI